MMNRFDDRPLEERMSEDIRKRLAQMMEQLEKLRGQFGQFNFDIKPEEYTSWLTIASAMRSLIADPLEALGYELNELTWQMEAIGNLAQMRREVEMWQNASQNANAETCWQHTTAGTSHCAEPQEPGAPFCKAHLKEFLQRLPTDVWLRYAQEADE